MKRGRENKWEKKGGGKKGEKMTKVKRDQTERNNDLQEKKDYYSFFPPI